MVREEHRAEFIGSEGFIRLLPISSAITVGGRASPYATNIASSPHPLKKAAGLLDAQMGASWIGLGFVRCKALSRNPNIAHSMPFSTLSGVPRLSSPLCGPNPMPMPGVVGPGLAPSVASRPASE